MNLIKLSQKDADWNNFRYMSLVCFFRGHYENLADTKGVFRSRKCRRTDNAITKRKRQTTIDNTLKIAQQEPTRSICLLNMSF